LLSKNLRVGQVDKALISATKLYKRTLIKKVAWPGYLVFPEAGYKFSQAKIVL